MWHKMKQIREYKKKDLVQMIHIWNEIVDAGEAFPQMEFLTFESAQEFFKEQSFTAVFEFDDAILGLYILHPNNIGRCAHIANASYAVKSGERGKNIGGALVLHSIEMAKKLGFRILQFNAVTAINKSALHLYKKLGFIQLGTIPGGFLTKDNKYIDIIPHYIEIK